MTHKIVDREGFVTTARARQIFEQIINETKPLRDSVCLDLVHGQYSDPKTYSIFFGFAIGLRAAQRFEQAGQPIE